MSAPDFGVGTAANVAAAGIIGIFKEIYLHVRYVFIHKKNVEKFEEKMKLLIEKRESVQQEVDAAKGNLEKIKADVQRWCERVDKTIDEEVQKVKDLEDKAKAKCFIGLCPNIKSRYQLSRKAEKDVAVVNQLLQQSGFNNVAVRGVPEAPISAAPKNYQAFDSRKEVLDQIVEALKDPTISIIGVYGPAGVGKTMLVREVARQVQEANLFAPVVHVTVTLSPKIEEIQGQIAELLGLNLENKYNRASLLSKRLEEEKKILFVLDDIWDVLNLDEVGICFGDQHKGCKILLASRDRHVLTNKMEAAEPAVFPITDLEEEEAWDLFKKMAGNDFENSDLLPVATMVAKRCAGLPLAIVTVARALRNKQLAEWKDALLQLQRPSPENFTGISKEVYSAIQLSYDKLEREELRKTIRLICLLGRNAHIEELLRYAMGLRLFSGVNTVEQTRNRVLTVVSKLKTSCLLLDGYDDDRLVMHDLVWDFALAIAKRDNNPFVLRQEDVFEEWPDEEEMQNFKMICLSSASIKKLPHALECPQLSLFSLAAGGWYSYVEMPPSFFEKTKNIRVLDLNGVDFSSLPSSIILPTSLRTLRLRWCKLGDMASLGELKNLEILSLSFSNIEVLPVEIGRLTKLRSLDLTACRKLKIIPPGVLSSLSRLEELYMRGVTVGWNQQGNAHVDELKELSCLTTVDICFPDAEIVPTDLFSDEPQRYKILIGVEWQRWEKFEYSRTMKLRANTSIDHLDHGVKVLLKKTEALYLENLEGVKIVLNQVGNMDCFLDLSQLEIRDASEMQYIMNDDDAVDKITFCRLRSLTLWNLPQLISFCSEKRSEGSTSAPQLELPLFGEQVTHLRKEEYNLSRAFCELRYLEVRDCGKLKNWGPSSVSFENLTTLTISGCHGVLNLIAFSTATSLVRLTDMSIKDCKMIKEIIASECDEVKGGIVFTCLKCMRLENLRSLASFCGEKHSFEFPALKEVSVINCPQMMIFNEGNLSTPILERVQFNEFGDKEHWEGSLNNTILRWFVEKEYDGLNKLLLSDSSNRMGTWNSSNWMGQWRFLKGSHWMGLKGTSSFRSVEILEVDGCSTLTCLFTVSIALHLKRLWRLIVKNCNVMEHIILDDGPDGEVKNEIVFSRLTFIILESCAALASFYQGSKILNCPYLTSLKVIGCPNMFAFASTVSREQSIETIDDGGNTSRPPIDAAFFNNMVEFPLLSTLVIRHLGNCKKIWHNHLINNSFSNLYILEVRNCDKLLNVFSFSMSERLRKLEKFVVEKCDSLEEIFEPQVLNANELHKEIATESFVFNKLWRLQLSCLPNLASFCMGKQNFEFPALEKMVVSECPKMKIFCQGDLSTPQMQKVILAEDEDEKIWRWEGNLNTTVQRAFEEMNV